MKRPLIAVVLLVPVLLFGQQGTAKTNPDSDIRQFYFVMLTSGPHHSDTAGVAPLQAAHLANITRLYKAGKIKVAGPFGDDGNWRGIFIFDCATREETESLLKSDPMISAGRLNYEIHPWFTQSSGSFLPGIPKS
jgi:uncharacterized protein YciI